MIPFDYEKHLLFWKLSGILSEDSKRTEMTSSNGMKLVMRVLTINKNNNRYQFSILQDNDNYYLMSVVAVESDPKFGTLLETLTDDKALEVIKNL